MSISCPAADFKRFVYHAPYRGLWKATVTMEHLEKPQVISHSEKSLNYTVFGVKWMPSSAKIVVLGSHPRDTGALQLYELNKGQLNLILEVWCAIIRVRPST